jgi:hypothetical protein
VELRILDGADSLGGTKVFFDTAGTDTAPPKQSRALKLRRPYRKPLAYGARAHPSLERATRWTPLDETNGGGGISKSNGSEKDC